MKRFLWFCLGLVVVTALLINTGCVTAQDRGKSLLMDWLEEELEHDYESKTPKDLGQLGWFMVGEDGYHWEYRVLASYDNIAVLAKCEYTYMKISGVRKWKGTYYGTPTDFYEGDPPVDELDELSGCVDWVNHHMNGDYFI